MSAKSFDLLVKQQKVQIFIMFIKDIDQQLQFNVKNQMKLINLNNVEIAVVNFQNIKKNCFLNIMIILTSSIEFKSINFFYIKTAIIRLSF